MKLEDTKYTDEILEALSKVVELPGWEIIKSFLEQRIEILSKTLRIPLVEMAEGIDATEYVATISMVQGQIKELDYILNLLEMASKVPKEAK